MEIIIGLKETSEKIQLDVDMTREELEELFSQVINTPRTPLVLKDKKDRVTMINPAVLSWVQIGPSQERKVGFGVG